MLDRVKLLIHCHLIGKVGWKIGLRIPVDELSRNFVPVGADQVDGRQCAGQGAAKRSSFQNATLAEHQHLGGDTLE